MKYISLSIAFLFVLGLIRSVNSYDVDNAIAQVIIIIVNLIFFLVLRFDDTYSQNFAEWLSDQEVNTHNGYLLYNGVVIDEATQFVQYEICFSIGFFTYRRKTNYYIKEYHPTALLNLIFSCYTFIFGWWGVPMGPVHTIGCLRNNLFGRSKSIDEIRNEL